MESIDAGFYVDYNKIIFIKKLEDVLENKYLLKKINKEEIRDDGKILVSTKSGRECDAGDRNVCRISSSNHYLFLVHVQEK